MDWDSKRNEITKIHTYVYGLQMDWNFTNGVELQLHILGKQIEWDYK